MFACLHGQGNLTALAFEFSPTVEQTAEGTVTLDASGLDRLFGLPQDMAAALARRAAEVRVKAHIALAANPDAAICAARGFTGVSVIPYGDESKFLELNEVILKACAKEPRDRYRSAGEMLADLEFLQDGQSLRGVRIRRQKVLSGLRAAAIILGAAMIAAVGAGTFATLEECSAALYKCERVFLPEPRNRALYEELYHRYVELYRHVYKHVQTPRAG